MREPDFDQDGWCLEDGEALHSEAPETFWLPHVERREALQPGDLAKLIFRIAVDNDEEPVAVERMWVLVRERVGEHYLGILDNDPFAIEENDDSGAASNFRSRLATSSTSILPMKLRARWQQNHQHEHGHATDG